MTRPEKATNRTIARTRAKNRFIGGWPRIALCMGSALVTLLASASPQAFAASPVEVTDFGFNPGNLRMFEFLPDGLPPSAPLVVVMHGCTQNRPRSPMRPVGFNLLTNSVSRLPCLSRPRSTTLRVVSDGSIPTITGGIKASHCRSSKWWTR